MSEKELILRKIKELYPGYERASRGRARIKQINDIPADKRKKFFFYEEKLKLLNNKVAAKKNRRKNKLYLENLEEKVTELEKKIKIQEKEIKILRNKIPLLKRKNEKLNNFSNTTPPKVNPPSLPTPSPQISPTFLDTLLPPNIISAKIPITQTHSSIEEVIKFEEIDYGLDLEIF